MANPRDYKITKTEKRPILDEDMHKLGEVNVVVYNDYPPVTSPSELRSTLDSMMQKSTAPHKFVTVFCGSGRNEESMQMEELLRNDKGVTPIVYKDTVIGMNSKGEMVYITRGPGKGGLATIGDDVIGRHPTISQMVEQQNEILGVQKSISGQEKLDGSCVSFSRGAEGAQRENFGTDIIDFDKTLRVIIDPVPGPGEERSAIDLSNVSENTIVIVATDVEKMFVLFEPNIPKGVQPIYLFSTHGGAVDNPLISSTIRYCQITGSGDVKNSREMIKTVTEYVNLQKLIATKSGWDDMPWDSVEHGPKLSWEDYIASKALIERTKGPERMKATLEGMLTNPEQALKELLEKTEKDAPELAQYLKTGDTQHLTAFEKRKQEEALVLQKKSEEAVVVVPEKIPAPIKEFFAKTDNYAMCVGATISFYQHLNQLHDMLDLFHPSYDRSQLAGFTDKTHTLLKKIETWHKEHPSDDTGVPLEYATELDTIMRSANGTIEKIDQNTLLNMKDLVGLVSCMDGMGNDILKFLQGCQVTGLEKAQKLSSIFGGGLEIVNGLLRGIKYSGDNPLFEYAKSRIEKFNAKLAMYVEKGWLTNPKKSKQLMQEAAEIKNSVDIVKQGIAEKKVIYDKGQIGIGLIQVAKGGGQIVNAFKKSQEFASQLQIVGHVISGIDIAYNINQYYAQETASTIKTNETISGGLYSNGRELIKQADILITKLMQASTLSKEEFNEKYSKELSAVAHAKEALRTELKFGKDGGVLIEKLKAVEGRVVIQKAIEELLRTLDRIVDSRYPVQPNSSLYQGKVKASIRIGGVSVPLFTNTRFFAAQRKMALLGPAKSYASRLNESLHSDEPIVESVMDKEFAFNKAILAMKNSIDGDPFVKEYFLCVVGKSNEYTDPGKHLAKGGKKIDITQKAITLGTTLGVSALVPGVGWGFAIGVVSSLVFSSIADSFKHENTLDANKRIVKMDLINRIATNYNLLAAGKITPQECEERLLQIQLSAKRQIQQLEINYSKRSTGLNDRIKHNIAIDVLKQADMRPDTLQTQLEMDINRQDITLRESVKLLTKKHGSLIAPGSLFSPYITYADGTKLTSIEELFTAAPEKLVVHNYKKGNFHYSTDIQQLVLQCNQLAYARRDLEAVSKLETTPEKSQFFIEKTLIHIGHVKTSAHQHETSIAHVVELNKTRKNYSEEIITALTKAVAGNATELENALRLLHIDLEKESAYQMNRDSDNRSWSDYDRIDGVISHLTELKSDRREITEYQTMLTKYSLSMLLHTSGKEISAVHRLESEIHDFLVPTSSKIPVPYDFSQELLRSGFIRHDVPGDGNCFFHAIAHQLGTIGQHFDHEQLRAMAIDHILSQPNLYHDFVADRMDKFIAENVKSGTWADHVMIQALANALKMNINIHNSDNTVSPITPTGLEPSLERQTLKLAYTGNHYMSLTVMPRLRLFQRESSELSSQPALNEAEMHKDQPRLGGGSR